MLRLKFIINFNIIIAKQTVKGSGRVSAPKAPPIFAPAVYIQF